MGMRLFLRTFFITFLGAILLANFIFFANMGNIMLSPHVDYSNKYVGFNSILSMINSFGEDDFLSNFRNFNDTLLQELQKLTVHGFKSFASIYDLESFFQAFEDFFLAIASLFAYIWYPILYVVYFLCSVVLILSKFVYFLYGGYAYQIPPNIYGL